jgi:hypothetical protein
MADLIYGFVQVGDGNDSNNIYMHNLIIYTMSAQFRPDSGYKRS